MSIIEIYKDVPTTMWQNDETYLCVFDDDGNLVADYDFCTGLKLLLREDELIVYINDDDLLSGRWEFFATKVAEDFSVDYVKAEGRKDGDSGQLPVLKDNPWDGCMPGVHVTKTERDERLDICKACPFFDITEMMCTVNRRVVLETTKHKYQFCPEGKWGDAEAAQQAAVDAQGELAQPIGKVFDPDEQADFEAELERFLEGL